MTTIPTRMKKWRKAGSPGFVDEGVPRSPHCASLLCELILQTEVHLGTANNRYWPFRDQTERLQPMYPYVALRSPTYRENSHANHTRNPQARQSACFSAPAAPPVWVRFPSPAPSFVV